MDSFGANDKSVRRRADEVKGIAGNQFQDFTCTGFQDRNVIGTNHSHGGDAISELALKRCDHNDAVSPDIPQRAGKSSEVPAERGGAGKQKVLYPAHDYLH
jgi:hypothetical protein